MSFKKIVYVAEILIEVAKVLLPYVKARKITIHDDNDCQNGSEAADE